MEKQTLEKIYKLRKISADSDWKETTKNNILQKDASFDYSFLGNFSLNRSLSLATVFAVFVLFTIPVIGGYQKDYQETTTFVYQNQQEEEKMVANEEEQTVAKAEELKPIKQELGELQLEVRELKLELLASRTGKQEKEEIAKELISEIERKGAEEMISMLGIEEEDDDSEALKDMKQAYEEGDYNKVFDIYIEEL
jgi:hypothetical protein